MLVTLCHMTDGSIQALCFCDVQGAACAGLMSHPSSNVMQVDERRSNKCEDVANYGAEKHKKEDALARVKQQLSAASSDVARKDTEVKMLHGQCPSLRHQACNS
jgi:hypothetical protein